MPSLLRFLTVVGVLGGLTYGAMFMLASWFDPKPREITVSIPPDRFAKQPSPLARHPEWPPRAKIPTAR